jgi:hypothetical protein
MAQKPEGTLPLYLNTDVAFEKMQPNETAFSKGVEVGISKNPVEITGNQTGEGQNALDLTPTRSNSLVPNAVVPAGYNKYAGGFYSEVTRETYYANYNDQGDNGLYVMNGDTGEWAAVIIDSNLPFTPYQQDFLMDHRWKIRVLYGPNQEILEKFVMFSNAAGWQGYIPVITAQKTNGFNAGQFPYFTLLQPHFDRRELLELAVRPPMLNPTIVPIPNAPADLLKVNRIIDQAFQIAYVFNYTDGRPSTYSPYSLPLIVKSEDYLNNPDILPKNALITMYAGSCLVESVDIMIRFTAKKQLGIPSTLAWGDWQKYIRIYKYPNQSDVFQTEYWLRTNPWDNYNYDPIQNTIQYVFDNSVLPEITSQDNAARLENNLPVKSIGSCDVNDSIAFIDNLYGRDNLPATTMDNLSVSVIEKPSAVCQLPNRKVTLYAVIPRPGYTFTWESQVGFYDGEDTQMRFGSLTANNTTGVAQFNLTETKSLDLDFSDHSALVCYAKGTPYSVVGEWYQVDGENNLTKLPALLDFSSNDVLEGVNSALLSRKYFVCVFNFELPAGRYDFCIGRHNVSLSDDYKNTSTYVRGIANSRLRQDVYGGLSSFITNNSLVSNLKEMEIDCTNGDVDVWGNGHDLFFIYCPTGITPGGVYFRFIEGYLKESPNNQIGVELFPYGLNIGAQDSGQITDKNGFYWAYVVGAHNVDTASILFTCKLNCVYPVTFQIITIANVFGFIQNGFGYITDHNNSIVGDCNRVLITGKITDLTGLIPYQNISISIANGSSVVTASDGTFTLVVHNGQNFNRVDNIYVGTSGNFLVTLAGCTPMPLMIYNEALVPCFACTVRNYPLPVYYRVVINGGTQFSLKENVAYQTTMHVADLAGRMGFENVISSTPIPSFLERNDVLATYLQANILGSLGLYSDIAWVAFSVSNPIGLSRYFQWVGDSIAYIDNQGNVVDDPSTAVFISIAIDSLYNYNVSKNFSVLASYQFSPDDRIRFLDDGNGNLLNGPAFGAGINLPVLGTNYNQAMQTAGIVPSTSTIPIVNNTINNNTQTTVNTAGGAPSTTTSFETTQNNVSITLYVKFDPRLAALKGNSGFWIEIYTPAQQAQETPYNELIWYPVINGELAEFVNIVNGSPVYNYPTTIALPYWDTYLFFRNINIPNVGDKFLNHPFESPNISDSFGANVTSGGRKLDKNDDAQRQWAQSDIIKSDAFFGNGIINGIGTFRPENRKNFSQYPFGSFQAAHTERNIILIVCENDWFTVTFDFHFTYPNAQGVMVVNLDNNISTPSQKIGSNFGIRPEDTSTFVTVEKNAYWYDVKLASWVKCDYREAVDISDLRDENGRPMGVKSYFIKKTQYMTTHNSTAATADLMDVVVGADLLRRNIYITFRPRRNNSNDPRAFVNKRRNIDLSHQETIVFSTGFDRWTRFQGFAPEGYSYLKGNDATLQFIMFAGGLPYGKNIGNNGFLNFFGIQTEAVFMTIFNRPPDLAKVLQATAIDCNAGFYIDLVFTGQEQVFSYIPINQFQQKEGIYYAAFLRDMYSYPKPGPTNLFRSMLYDGSRLVDVYSIARFVVDPSTQNGYFELNNIFCYYTKNYPDKK